MMYEGVRGALAADDALKQQDQEIPFRVRETPEWKKHAAALEAEMLKREMSFEVIETHQRRSQTRAAAMLRPALRENATDPPIAAGGARNLR